MQSQQIEFLNDLVNTPGVSGYEQQVQQVVRDYAESFCDTMTTDLHGNLVLCKNPDADVRLMLAGHADQIGLIVSFIDDEGFIYTQTVGGWDPQQLIGQRMTVWSSSGPIPGVIARKAIHLLEGSEKKTVVKASDLWVDIGSQSRAETEQRVQIGDPITLQLGLQMLMNNRATGPAMDNRTGVWVVVEALRRSAALNPRCGFYAVTTVQEEVGLRGARTAAHSINPHIGIAVDVTHATDCPTITKYQNGSISLGGGPVVVRGPNINPEVNARLKRIAAENDIPFQQKALGRAAPNDSNALQVTRDGVAAGILAIPNRYMHSAVETICLDDLEHAADLLAKFAASVKDEKHFIPKIDQ